MTKPRDPNPQPTSDTNYSIYLWPRAKDPKRQRIYDWLHDHDWRYDATTGLFHTPESDPLQGVGTLETAPDCSWARIQPPSIMSGPTPHRRPALLDLKASDYEAV